MTEEALPEPEEEIVHLPISIPNLGSESIGENDIKSIALEKLAKKCNRVHKYLHKMLKLLRENDSAFCDRFLENLKIDKEKWDDFNSKEKVMTLFPIFEKLIVVLRYHGLLRMFKEKMYRKLSALCRGYLKVYNTYRCYFPLEADKFMDKHRSGQAASVSLFADDIRNFGYSRAEAEEAERYKVAQAYGRRWYRMTSTLSKRIDLIIVMLLE